MKVDTSNSIYHEAEDAASSGEFDRQELRRCRLLLRRLRFLEAQLAQTGGMANGGSGGAAYAEWEVEALEWALSELGFLDEDRVRKAVRR